MHGPEHQLTPCVDHRLLSSGGGAPEYEDQPLTTFVEGGDDLIGEVSQPRLACECAWCARTLSAKLVGSDPIRCATVSSQAIL